MNEKGIVLIVLVIIIVLLAIVALGIATYITEALNFNIANIDQEKALYAAQAGVMSAIVDYVNNGSITAETDIQIADDTYYSTGGAGMFFLADCSSPRIIASRKIKDISMTNLNSTDAVTITHMQVSWTPDEGENFTSIDLGRATVEWTGSVPSGTNVDMTDYTIGAGISENDVWLDWETGSDMSLKTISAVLTFSDGSTLEIVLLDEGQGSDNAIVITSTAKAVGSYTWKRTIRAGYDVGTNEITSWEESLDHL